MRDKQEPKRNAPSTETTHYAEKFIATEENRQKIKRAFDKSREDSMNGKYDEIVEV